MPKISDLAYAGELGAANYILGVRDGVAVRFPIEVFEDEPIVNSSFTVLTDTPADYVGQAGKLPAVNEAEDALEFIDPPTSLPSGGTAGQVLTKHSETEGDAGWGDAVSTFLGLSDTPDSYSAYIGKVVAVKADGSGLEFVSASAGSYTIVDLTSATEDYAMSTQEIAKITYISATSVPLHIATEDGMYEIEILGNATATGVDSENAFLPNNTSYSSAVKQFDSYQYNNSTLTNEYITNKNNFGVLTGIILRGSTRVVTKVTTKTVFAEYICKMSSGYLQGKFSQIWADTTTVWTSLGTLSFANAQSGTVFVRRIV